MPHSSSIFFFSSTSSSTDILPSSSKTLSTPVAAITPPRFLPKPALPPPLPWFPLLPRRPAPLREPRPRYFLFLCLGLGLDRCLGCRLRLRFRLDRLLAAELVDAGLDQAVQVLQRRREQPDDRVQRRRDGAEYLAAQNVRRRELRELLDLLGRDRATLHDPAADGEDLGRLRRVGERLRDGDGVAARLEERDRARAVEQREQRVGARGLGRAARQRVLDDGEARAPARAAWCAGRRSPSRTGRGSRRRSASPSPAGAP